MDPQKEIGVLYIVFDDAEMLKECIHSANSLRKYSPGIPAQLITNLSPKLFKLSTFEHVDLVSDSTHPLKAKVKYLLQSRFSTTLFLDADTEIRGDITELFDSLNGYDLALTHDNHCDWDSTPILFINQESEDINTGMMLYKKNKMVLDLFGEWLRLIMPQNETVMKPGTYSDQWYFNTYLIQMALSGETVRTKIVSNEIYNVRPWCWRQLKLEKKFDKVKILHAHHLHHGFFTKLKRKVSSLFS